MSLVGRSLVSLKNWSLKDIEGLFFISSTFKSNKNTHIDKSSGKLVSLAFFEPSTRTKMSFQVAMGRLGLLSADLGTLSDSSMSKGESFSETVRTIESMQPDLLILRANTTHNELETINRYTLPIINAGCGAVGHPTQALTDAFTIKEKYNLKNLKVLFVGDSRHSRVVQSNIRLLSKFENIQFGFCGPQELLPEQKEFSQFKYFESLDEALSWCDICMGLRLQKERHSDSEFSLEDYRRNYQITSERVQAHLHEDAMILHPGPHVPGLDFEQSVLEDPRCFVRKQVNNGVYIRMALMSAILGLV